MQINVVIYPDNKSRQSSTKSTLNNLANYSPSEQEESIDDMNLGILVEDVKIEDINLDEEDEIDDLSVEHVAVESDKEEESNFFIESGDEVAANSSVQKNMLDFCKMCKKNAHKLTVSYNFKGVCYFIHKLLILEILNLYDFLCQITG